MTQLAHDHLDSYNPARLAPEYHAMEHAVHLESNLLLIRETPCRFSDESDRYISKIMPHT